ncbi:cytochrome P450 2J6-like [Diadema antillarum]|uniref:cytochrome P450 2J6-like n=1 Tax=Diadema antillarum TaxID=105358 RepID=UPI003A87B65D
MLMLGMQSVLLFAITTLLTMMVVRWYRRRSRLPGKLPPGPWGLPLVGSIFSLGKQPHMTLMDMARKYGNVFTLNLAGQLVVVLNGYDTVREALVKKAGVFAGRPHLALTQELTEGQGIVVADSGPVWREQRRFTLTSLRNFGFGRQNFEGDILEEIRHMLDAFREKDHSSFNADHIVEIAVSNVVCNFNFGRRFDYQDPKFQLLVDSIYRFAEIGTNAAAINFFPFLKHFPIPEIREVFEIDKVVRSFLQRMIAEHKETLDEANQRDFIDTYLVEIRRRQEALKRGERISEADESFTESYLFHILNDLIFAGTETMSSTIRWAILYMIVQPDIQSRVQAELDSVVAPSGLPSWRDRKNLPYTEATLMEIQRMANITALTFPHKTTEDTELSGYSIPKDTHVFVNLYSVHVDPTHWAEPEKFRPERFLVDGKVVHRPALMPFSAGRRACPGETLARMELFLFFAALLRFFTLVPAPENPNPSIDKNYGISLNPKSYKICAIPRQ